MVKQLDFDKVMGNDLNGRKLSFSKGKLDTLGAKDDRKFRKKFIEQNRPLKNNLKHFDLTRPINLSKIVGKK